MKFRQVGAELFHAGGQTDRETDMMKLTFAFRNFWNAPKNRRAQLGNPSHGLSRDTEHRHLTHHRPHTYDHKNIT